MLAPPAMKHRGPDWHAAVAPERQSLAEACIAKLQRQCATPLEPHEWRMRVQLPCSCRDCHQLQEFLQDPRQQVLQFSPNGANKAVMDIQHVEQ